MSGPVADRETVADRLAGQVAAGPEHEVSESRLTDVGGIPVHRALPRHGRRTVGAWCFLDRFGPVATTPDRTMMVGPHPHIGLHTVTWLLSGEVLHTDSLGNRQSIRPGHLNLMTAGHGIAHAEDARIYEGRPLDGVQLWVAQPDTTRHGPAAFAHHADLPVVELGGGRATVLLGELAGAVSPAIIDSPLVGAEMAGSGAISVPVRPDFEHGIMVLAGTVKTSGGSDGVAVAVAVDQFLYFSPGVDRLDLVLAPGTRLLLLGGEPFEEEIAMWWNFVARDRAELERAAADWQADDRRFGPVDSALERIDAPRPFWVI